MDTDTDTLQPHTETKTPKEDDRSSSRHVSTDKLSGSSDKQTKKDTKQQEREKEDEKQGKTRRGRRGQGRRRR